MHARRHAISDTLHDVIFGRRDERDKRKKGQAVSRGMGRRRSGAKETKQLLGYSAAFVGCKWRAKRGTCRATPDRTRRCLVCVKRVSSPRNIPSLSRFQISHERVREERYARDRSFPNYLDLAIECIIKSERVACGSSAQRISIDFEFPRKGILIQEKPPISCPFRFPLRLIYLLWAEIRSWKSTLSWKTVEF